MMSPSLNITSSTNLEYEKKSHFLFFYKDYKRTFYYWESTIFLLKFVLSLLPNVTGIFGDENIDLIFVVSMLIYFSAVSKFCPFRVEKLNKLEALSTILTIFSRFAIICINSHPNDVLIVVIFFFAFILMNSIFFLLAFYYLVKYNDWKAFFAYYKGKYQGMKNIMQKMTKSPIITSAKLSNQTMMLNSKSAIKTIKVNNLVTGG